MKKTPVVSRLRKVTPLVAVERLCNLADAFLELGIPVSSLNGAAQVLQSHFEGLPVHWEGVKKGWVYGFVLAGGDWFPCHALIEIKEGRHNGSAQYRIDYEDGSCESGIVLKYKWAHCTADDTVNYHWLDPIEDAEGNDE